jgi:hypothetical protein
MRDAGFLQTVLVKLAELALIQRAAVCHNAC